MGIVADTVCYGTLQVLRVANQKLIPTLVSISIMALGLLAAYLLGFTSGMNLFGLELGSALSTFMTAMVLMPMWISFTSEKHFDDVSRAENQIVIEGEESIFKRCKSCFFGSQTLDLQNDISDSDLLETDRLLDTNQTRVYEV